MQCTLPSSRITRIQISLYLSDSLFDMDGTLVDSTEGVVGAWHTFAETYPHLNVQEILDSMISK